MNRPARSNVSGYLLQLMLYYINRLRVKLAPCLYVMVRPQVADGGDGLQMWRATANALNKPVENS
jgi:hypothetical protein